MPGTRPCTSAVWDAVRHATSAPAEQRAGVRPSDPRSCKPYSDIEEQFDGPDFGRRFAERSKSVPSGDQPDRNFANSAHSRASIHHHFDLARTLERARRCTSADRVAVRHVALAPAGASTQVSGAQAILAAGSLTVTLKNITTGLTSGGASLSVH